MTGDIYLRSKPPSVRLGTKNICLAVFARGYGALLYLLSRERKIIKTDNKLTKKLTEVTFYINYITVSRMVRLVL
jgi:hypothetical protein